MKTDTPRTDAAEPQLYSNKGGWVRADFARELERELAESQAQSHGLARRVVEAETKLEVAERDLSASNAALDQMTEDAVNFKAEVERLTKELAVWDYGTRAKREQYARKKAEADVERLAKLAEDCLSVIRVYCPTYYNDAMERFNNTAK